MQKKRAKQKVNNVSDVVIENAQDILPKRPIIRRMISTYLKPYFGQLASAMFFMVIAAVMTAIFAQLIQPIIDDVLNAKKEHLILPMSFAILGTFAARGLASYFHTVIMNRIGQSIVADVQNDMFDHLMRADLAFFHANPSGQLISRIVNDVNVMRTAVSDSLTGIGRSLLTLILLVGVMFYQDWRLSIGAFIIFPFAAWFVASLGRRLKKISGHIQGDLAHMSATLSQIFLGIRQVKAYGMEDYERQRASNIIGSLKKLIVKTVKIGTLSTPVNDILVGMVVFSIIVYGGYQVLAGNTTPGALMSFITAFLLAYEPMKKLAKLNNGFQIGLGAAERVFDLLDTQINIKEKPDAEPLVITKAPPITFKDVHFSYGQETVLHNVSFEIGAGEVVALVGPSGGGKSTLMNLLPRFYDVQDGAVLINEKNIRNCSLKTLRSNIALVSQEVAIFDDTIRNNIAYGTENATDDDIIAAAKAAAAHDFISALPAGYNTSVGENGVTLSGGQRQRISIARAVLRNAPILLLDEATSALDTESERAIQETLQELQKGRTTLIIAHRLSTVQNADKIVVIEGGRVAEEGPHTQLLQNKGLYARLYGMQDFDAMPGQTKLQGT